MRFILIVCILTLLFTIVSSNSRFKKQKNVNKPKPIVPKVQIDYDKLPTITDFLEDLGLSKYLNGN
jgi:hypothetical protein